MIWFLTHPYLTFFLAIVLLSVINTTLQGIINIFGFHKKNIPDETLIKEDKVVHADSFVDPNMH